MFKNVSKKVTDVLDNYNLFTIMVLNNLTHLLPSLDLRTNHCLNNVPKISFTDYFTNTITKELQINPKKDVKITKVDLKFAILQIHPPQSDDKNLLPLQK